MSIATQIARLQTIKTNIRTALVNKGVSGASTHDMEDFADDISRITSGTNVSDTTAVASDVVNTKYFYTASGSRTKGTLTIDSVSPTDNGTSLTANKNYKPSTSGYFLKTQASEVNASSSGRAISGGAVVRFLSNVIAYPKAPYKVLTMNSNQSTFSLDYNPSVILIRGKVGTYYSMAVYVSEDGNTYREGTSTSGYILATERTIGEHITGTGHISITSLTSSSLTITSNGTFVGTIYLMQ